MKPNYNIEKTEKEIPLTRENVEGKVIRYTAGLSAADSKNFDRPRDRERFLKDVLAPMIASGEVKDGKRGGFDDRKFRFHSTSIKKDVLEIQLGITYYQECVNCCKLDEKKRARLIAEGEARFNEPYAFFTRGCCIEVTPVTADGSIFIGKRKVKDKSSGYSEELAAVNGWVDYKENLEDADFQQDAIRELEEEYGISESEIKRLVFVGVFSSISQADTDFAYLAWTNIPDNFFIKGYYKKRRKDKEHGELVRIASFSEMRRLLKTHEIIGQKGKFNILYSLKASLQQIKKGEITA